MILLYYAFILSTGYTMASIFHPKKEKGTFLKLALAPALGIFLPILLLYSFNLTTIPLRSGYLFCFWLPLGFLILFNKREDLILLLLKIQKFYHSENKYMRIVLVVGLLGLIGMACRVINTPIWSGDGLMNWGPKALEWFQNERIIYRDPHFETVLRDWVSYPLYHYLGMMVNLMGLPHPPAYSIKAFDTLFVWGILFSCAYFFRWLGWGMRAALLGALTCTMAQKNLLSLLVSGYAENEMAYYYFLGSILLLSSFQESPNRSTTNDFLGGLLLGLMVITKNEGAFRLAFLLSILTLSQWKRIPSFKKLMAIATPILILKALDHSNAPVTYTTDFYYERLNFSFDHLLHRFPIMVKASYYALRPEGLFKSFWVTVLALTALTLWRAFREKWPQRQLLFTLFLIFITNWIFNHIPSWISDPSEDSRALAREIVGRLNGQCSTFLSAIAVIGIHQVLKVGDIPRRR